MRDVLGAIYEDEDFAEIFEVRGRPAIAPWRLALVTVMHFAEGLSDRQAAEDVCAFIDWKYALGLELTEPTFSHWLVAVIDGSLSYAPPCRRIGKRREEIGDHEKGS